MSPVGEGDGTPLQYSCWKIPWAVEPGRLQFMDGVAKSRTRLSDFPFTFHFHALEKESEVAHSSLTLCHPMDCSLSGSSVHGIFQARVLEWIAISFSRRSSRPSSRGSSQPRNRTRVSRVAGRRFTIWATRDPLQHSCLENPRDGGAWWAAVYGVTQSQRRLKLLSHLAT